MRHCNDVLLALSHVQTRTYILHCASLREMMMRHIWELNFVQNLFDYATGRIEIAAP